LTVIWRGRVTTTFNIYNFLENTSLPKHIFIHNFILINFL